MASRPMVTHSAQSERSEGVREVITAAQEGSVPVSEESVQEGGV